MRARILELHDEGYTSAQIVEKLSGEEQFADRTPHERTVRKIASEAAPRPGEPWSLLDPESPAIDAALVLPALREVIRRTEHRVLAVTRDEARWISRLRRADPELPGWNAYRLARQYVAAEAAGMSTAALDRAVALQAWSSLEAASEHLTLETGIKMVIEERTDGA